MATTKNPPDDQPAGTPGPGAASHARPSARPSQQTEKPILTAPVYYGRPRRYGRDGDGDGGGGGRRRRPRYSRGTRASQRLLFGGERATYRIANSFARGLRTFVRRSDRSRRRRKDGLLRDQFRNFSRGFNVAADELGRAPGEIAWRIGTRNARNIGLAFIPGNPFRIFG